jgi:putative membrane protein
VKRNLLIAATALSFALAPLSYGQSNSNNQPTGQPGATDEINQPTNPEGSNSNNQPTQPPSNPQTPADIQPNPGPKPAGSNANQQQHILGQEDADFEDKTAASNQFEIQSSQAALQQSQNPAVKRFAQEMIRDHTRMGDEFTRIAKRTGRDVSTDLGADMQSRLSALQNGGQGFEKAYVDAQVQAHEEAIALFEKEAKGGRSTALRRFAQSHLATLRHHLKMAQDLQKSMP